MTSSANADDAIDQIPLHFGKTSTSISHAGTLTAYQSVDFLVSGRAGKTMSVTLKTDHPSHYFNVLPPSSETALFIGSTSGTQWQGVLSEAGEYRIRTYLMRSAARRGETANYSLEVALRGEAPGAVGTEMPGAAKVPGTPFHASGTLTCRLGRSAQQSRCPFGVTRKGPGRADVLITPPFGFSRVLQFDGDKVSSDGAEIKAQKEGEWWLIEVNDQERYELPLAVIGGG